MGNDVKKRESSHGFHFYHLYADCPRKWYLKYVCGFKPEFTGKALIFGGVVHDAIEGFYRELMNGSPHPEKVCLEGFKEMLAAREADYESILDYQNDMQRGPLMLDTWLATYGLHDLENYDILGVEHERVLQLGGGDTTFLFTVRPDLVVREKATRLIHVMDHKTSGWSIDGTIKSASLQDQLTGYVWAERKAGVEVEGAVVDVMYMKGSKVEARRSDPFYFTKYAIAQFELGMFGLISEVSQKYLELGNVPCEILFPRFGESCSKFGCEYELICRNRAEPGNPPAGFTLDEWYIDDEMKQAQRVFGRKEG